MNETNIYEEIIQSLKIVGRLPGDYDYRLIHTGEVLKIIGIACDKPPISFILQDGVLSEVNKCLKCGEFF